MDLDLRIYRALTQNRLIAPVWQRLRTKVGVRFTRFAGVAILALATSEITLALCNGVLHMTATPAALVSNFTGAAVSYVLSRWAWERKGKPDVLRETVPFYVITAASAATTNRTNRLAPSAPSRRVTGAGRRRTAASAILSGTEAIRLLA